MISLVLTTMLAATPDEREAQRLFDEARVAMKAKSWDVACPKLERSRRLAATLGTTINLGVCLESSQQPRRAFLVFQDALVLARRQSDGPRADFVTTRLDALRAKLGWLEVKATGLPLPGTMVEFGDERREFSESFTEAVEPGPLALRFSAQGAVARTVTVDVAAGKTLLIEIAPLQPEVSKAPPPVDPAPVAERVLTPEHAPTSEATLPTLERTPPRQLRPAFLGGLLVSSLVTIGSTVGFIWSRSIADQALLQQMTGVLSVTRAQYETAATLHPLSIVGLIAGVVGGVTFGSLAFAER